MLKVLGGWGQKREGDTDQRSRSSQCPCKIPRDYTCCWYYVILNKSHELPAINAGSSAYTSAEQNGSSCPLASNSPRRSRINRTSFELKVGLGNITPVQFGSVQSLSRVRLVATPWIAARQASLSITNSRSLPKLMSIESVMPSSHLILCHLLLFLPPIPPSIRVFSDESTLLIRWPKYWHFSINSSNEWSWFISFRIEWFYLLLSKRLSRVFSSTTVQKHQFFDAQPSLWSNSHIHTWLLENYSSDYADLCWQSNVFAF